MHEALSLTTDRVRLRVGINGVDLAETRAAWGRSNLQIAHPPLGRLLFGTLRTLYDAHFKDGRFLEMTQSLR